MADRSEAGFLSVVRRVSILLFSAGAICIVVGCFHGAGGSNENNGDRMVKRTIEQVHEAHASAWMDIPGVEGVAIGLFEDKPCIRILSSRQPEELRAKIPPVVEGYPVIIEQSGIFRALERQ